METKEIQIKTLFLCLAAVLAIELGTRVVTAKSVYHPMLILGGARLLEILLIVLIVVTWGKGLSSIGLAPSEMVSGLKKGLLWSAGFAAITSIVCIGLFAASMNPLTFIRAQIPTRTSDLILFFIVGGLLGPVAEEFFFRGVIVALVFSTLIFVLCHPIHQGIPVTRLLGGILFAVAYEISGSLIVPITIHGLGNLAIFTLSLII
jgi:membrane protease YdiL (CAAX protease family)